MERVRLEQDKQERELDVRARTRFRSLAWRRLGTTADTFLVAQDLDSKIEELVQYPGTADVHREQAYTVRARREVAPRTRDSARPAAAVRDRPAPPAGVHGAEVAVDHWLAERLAEGGHGRRAVGAFAHAGPLTERSARPDAARAPGRPRLARRPQMLQVLVVLNNHQRAMEGIHSRARAVRDGVRQLQAHFADHVA